MRVYGLRCRCLRLRPSHQLGCWTAGACASVLTSNHSRDCSPMVSEGVRRSRQVKIEYRSTKSPNNRHQRPILPVHVELCSAEPQASSSRNPGLGVQRLGASTLLRLLPKSEATKSLPDWTSFGLLCNFAQLCDWRISRVIVILGGRVGLGGRRPDPVSAYSKRFSAGSRGEFLLCSRRKGRISLVFLVHRWSSNQMG